MAKYKPKNSRNSNQRKINQALSALVEALGTKFVYPPTLISVQLLKRNFSQRQKLQHCLDVKSTHLKIGAVLLLEIVLLFIKLEVVLSIRDLI